MMRNSLCFAFCGFGFLAAAPEALAGDLVEPMIAPAAAAPAVRESTEDWAGGYAGGSLGYSMGADDVVSLDVYDGDTLIDRNADLAAVDMAGPSAGVHAGYRWQRGGWVFGPELTFEGGSVDAKDTAVFDRTRDVESSVKHIIGLQLKTGYAVAPRMLVYGTSGAIRGDFDYKLSGPKGSDTQDYQASGYSLGLGAERVVRPNLSVFAEWQYRNFGTTHLTFDDEGDRIVTRASPEHHNIKIGVNFSF